MIENILNENKELWMMNEEQLAILIEFVDQTKTVS